ncbi:MAG: lytic transglycosylase domain-containing protein [Myxococcota bacterium]
MVTRLLFLCVVLVGCSSKAEPNHPPKVAAARSAPEPAVAAAPAPEPLMRADVPIRVDGLGVEAQSLAEVEAMITAEKWDGALAVLAEREDPPARYLRAKIYRSTNRTSEARSALADIEFPDALKPWVGYERALLAQAEGDDARALRELAAIFGTATALDRRVTLPLARLRAERAPDDLKRDRQIHEAALDPSDADARARLLGILSGVLDDSGAVELQRYLEEPVSVETPKEAPRKLTLKETVIRAEALLAAHRNERVLAELAPVRGAKASMELRCRRDFAYGMAARKLRRYSDARTYLGRVVKGDCEPELRRRAHYLWAKVISISGGLAAIQPIEDFAKTYAGHSMVDDVLFWAGDMHQRRRRRKDAERYYARIQSMTPPGDHCAIARWRLAWMAYRAGESSARERLQAILNDDGCVDDAFERARATYWLARLDDTDGKSQSAAERYAAVTQIDPLGFYAQVAFGRLKVIDPPRYTDLHASHPAPAVDSVAELCPGSLASDETFLRGYELYQSGLLDEAASEWLTVEFEATEVLSGAHATALGEEAKPLEVDEGQRLERSCHPDHGGLLLALLLSKAREKAEAQWRLRTTYAKYLSHGPMAETGALWIAAYPLEAREFIGPAEEESQIPPLFLQALSREESAFDDQIVSWAGAYGLTQLLLSTGQSAGRLLEPPVNVTTTRQLLDPALNARLGAAYLGELLGKYREHPALALAAYNAGESVASTWWKRHAGDEIDVFAEEMTIKETRGYVKRVLRTHGIYRWLYEGKAPTLPAPGRIPELARSAKR